MTRPPSLYRASSSNSLAISSNLEALLDYDEQHRRKGSGSSLPERPPSTTPMPFSPVLAHAHGEFIPSKSLPPPPRGPRKPRSRSTVLSNEFVLDPAVLYGTQELEEEGSGSPGSVVGAGEPWGAGWASHSSTANPFINPAPTGPASLRSLSSTIHSSGDTINICDIAATEEARSTSVLSSISSTSFMSSRHGQTPATLRPASSFAGESALPSLFDPFDRPGSSLSTMSSTTVPRVDERSRTTRSWKSLGGLPASRAGTPLPLVGAPSEKPMGQLQRLLTKVGIFDGHHASERVSRARTLPQTADGTRKEGLLRLRGRKRHKEKLASRADDLD